MHYVVAALCLVVALLLVWVDTLRRRVDAVERAVKPAEPLPTPRPRRLLQHVRLAPVAWRAKARGVVAPVLRRR